MFRGSPNKRRSPSRPYWVSGSERRISDGKNSTGTVSFRNELRLGLAGWTPLKDSLQDGICISLN
ncbi:hypothetical protein WN55_04481 [Dufourea novaeangliae]|uniref:Uncharacterized protein n=1 Tax=Dufourea novaeangliae TaxID=178035 RepID=A0A154P106_DUFNO|nr:hypothetical protein WN55_04481 [Dufourea novaeangliae]